MKKTGSFFVACGESTSMLRVITERQGDRDRLDLHGTLGGEWAAVLEQQWRSIMDDVPSATVTGAVERRLYRSGR